MGLFKIATKMLSRDESMRNEIVHLLNDIFVVDIVETKSSVVSNQIENENNDQNVLTTHNDASSGSIYQSLSNQIACCMWQFLTANVDILPLFSLSQWQTIFDIIASTASQTDFAAMKAFEVSILL